MIDQLINLPLEVFYDELGAEEVFKIWWFFHLFGFFQIDIIGQFLIIYEAKKNFPEFNGLKARVYPGQDGPRPWQFLPYRYEKR